MSKPGLPMRANSLSGLGLKPIGDLLLFISSPYSGLRDLGDEPFGVLLRSKFKTLFGLVEMFLPLPLDITVFSLTYTFVLVIVVCRCMVFLETLMPSSWKVFYPRPVSLSH
jgi:hypothetical protein